MTTVKDVKQWLDGFDDDSEIVLLGVAGRVALNRTRVGGCTDKHTGMRKPCWFVSPYKSKEEKAQRRNCINPNRIGSWKEWRRLDENDD